MRTFWWRFNVARLVRAWAGSEWRFTGVTVGRVMFGLIVVPRGKTTSVDLSELEGEGL